MRIWPIGASAAQLNIYWPTWAAAGLRPRGPRPTSSLDAAAYRLALYLWLRRQGLSPVDGDSGLVWHRPPLVLEGRPPATQTPPELDLHWPYEDPPKPQDIIVVERVLHEEYPVSGEFIDVLY